MAEKKALDYTNSAVNLCNPPELKSLLTDLALLKVKEATAQTILQETTLYKELQATQFGISDCEKNIREAISTFGSYQDLDAGNYAIKQRKLSVTYVVAKVREFLRTYADSVIEEVVSKQKLEGLRKGGLVSQTDLDRCAETKESFAYIIKTGQGG